MKFAFRELRDHSDTCRLIIETCQRLSMTYPDVFDVFCEHAGLSSSAAQDVLSYGSGPQVQIRTLHSSIKGKFWPESPKIIGIAKRLAIAFEKHAGNAERLDVILTALHEAIHWSRYHRKLSVEYSDPATGLVHEAGEHFERAVAALPPGNIWPGLAALEREPDRHWGGRPARAPDFDPAQEMAGLPRGIRNNNPGNIRVSADNWLGLAIMEERRSYQKRETAFCVFRSPEFGLRAMARVLINYQRHHHLTTLEAMITRWAPPHENDTGSYVAFIASASALPPDENFDFATDPRNVQILHAMIQMENGIQPYSEAQLRQGIQLAIA